MSRWIVTLFAAVSATLVVAWTLTESSLAQPEKATLPLTTIVDKVAERYQGKLVDAEIKPPKRHETAAVVYELRLLTPAGAILKVRVDAATGAFLEIDGRGQLDALRPPR